MNENEAFRDGEIRFCDLVAQLRSGWKVLGGGVLLGLVVGAVIWSFQGYKGVMTTSVRPGVLNVVSWNALVAGFPGLADEKINATTGNAAVAPILQSLSIPAWWKANTYPVYMLSKSDVKDLAGISKEDLNEASKNIQRIVVKTAGKSRDDVRKMALFIEEFIRRGALCIELKSKINSYEHKVDQRPGELLRLIAVTEKEIPFLERRVAALESLRRSYPDQKGVSVAQVMDPKDSVAKFLPLSTQIVAAKSDLNEAQERLTRARSELAEIEVLRKFTDKALGILGSSSDGFVIELALKAELRELSKTIDANDRGGQVVLSAIQSDLDTAMVNRGKLFEGSPQIFVSRPRLLLSLGLGSAMGLLLGVVVVFMRQAFRRGEI